jgi:K+-transporting ATPase ATPase C chain
MIRRQLVPVVLILATMSVWLGVVYPLVVTGVAQVVFPHEADGSMVEVDGVPVASELIGQTFEGPEWFESRPSAAGEEGYDSTLSSGSNLGPTNTELIDEVAQGVERYRAENGLSSDVQVPVDAVTASGSGLDPHISVANARLQARRVAEARDLPEADVLELIEEHTDDRPLGVLGDRGVNVVLLNLELDQLVGSR